MAELTEIIGKQSFELIRDRIGEILATEILNQFNLTNEPEFNATVYSERFTPFSITDFPCVNVLFSSGTYSVINAVEDDGDYEFFIDVYTSGKSSDTEAGDSKSSRDLHRILGICRSILRSPHYMNLGFQTSVVGSSYISNIQVMEPSNKQDSSNSIWGRLIFKLKACEDVELHEALVLENFKTTVKLNLTEKGYLYEKK